MSCSICQVIQLFVEKNPRKGSIKNFFKIFRAHLHLLHNVCAKYYEEFLKCEAPMHLHRRLEDSELFDLLSIHTNRLTQIMMYGESYTGEYETCRRTIELIQNEVMARRGFYVKEVSIDKNLRRRDSAA